MDLAKLTDDEIEVLFAVFDSFNQGDVTDDLYDRRRSEEEDERIFNLYEQMSKSIFAEGLRRRTERLAK